MEGIRESVRQIGRRDDRWGAVGCASLALLPIGTMAALAWSAVDPWLVLIAGIGTALATVGFMGIHRLVSARRIARAIRQLSLEEKVDVLAPMKRNFAVREVLGPLAAEAKIRSEIVPSAAEVRGDEASPAERED